MIRKLRVDLLTVTPGLHHVRERWQGELELVLHLGPGEVRVGARGEGEVDLRGARRIGRRMHVEHLVQARHLRLDLLHDAVLDGLGRGAGVDGGDRDGRRRDGRILGDGEVVDGQTPGQHHRDGDDPGEDRAVQKESATWRAPSIARDRPR
jgi:hypothetical protein